MKYQNMVKATFIERPNRFIAYCQIAGEVHKVHVKNRDHIDMVSILVDDFYSS